MSVVCIQERTESAILIHSIKVFFLIGLHPNRGVATTDGDPKGDIDRAFTPDAYFLPQPRPIFPGLGQALDIASQRRGFGALTGDSQPVLSRGLGEMVVISIEGLEGGVCLRITEACTNRFKLPID